MTQHVFLLCSFNFILERTVDNWCNRSIATSIRDCRQCQASFNVPKIKINATWNYFSSIVNVSRQHKKHGEPFMGQNSWKMAINEAKCLQGTAVNLKLFCSRRKEIRFGVKGQANKNWSISSAVTCKGTVNAESVSAAIQMSNCVNDQLWQNAGKLISQSNTCWSALTACSCELMKSSSFRSKLYSEHSI